MNDTLLLLLRHAHTEANDRGGVRLSGWADTPLSARGCRQLELLRNVAFEAVEPVIYTSPSSRARRTAEAISNGRKIVLLRSLREIGCGAVDGWSVDEVMAAYPELWQRNLEQNDPQFAWPGGESYAAFRRRVLRVLRAIAARHRRGRVLVVTHAGLISQAVGSLRGVTPARWDQWRPANCSLTTLACDDDGTMRLVDFNSSLLPALTPADVRPSGE